MVLSRRGESLVELIVALVILEIVGAATLAAAFTVERIGRRAAAGAADDAVRWHDYRAAEINPVCSGAVAPDTVPLLFGATTNRPALATLLRCGR